MKKNKLKGKIAENGLNQSQCAEALGISLQAFNAKINESVEFKLSEAEILSKLLNLSDADTVDIFLS